MNRIVPLFLLASLALVPPRATADPAQRLAEAIRIPTISHEDPADDDARAFRRFHALVAQRFPAIHRAAKRETVNQLSLLYTWPGSDPALAPLLLTAHIDVVPVPEDALGRWTQPPFDGVIADGFVWGRGALDDKVGVMGMLEASERLLGEGFRPRRTVLLAFGHDEEVGGDRGAGATGALLEQRGIRPWMSLDEGMALLEPGLMPGVASAVAMIGVAEKGYYNVRITARAEGGHSSVPEPSSAIGRLARAISALEGNPMPVHLDGAAAPLLDGLADLQGFPASFVLRHRWLTGPILRPRLTASPATNALVRTTTAVTMVSGGVKANVLPSEATANVNFRLHPDDTGDALLAHVREVVGPDIEIEATRRTPASPVSSTDSDAWRTLVASVEAVFPGTPVLPGLVLGGTDTKHYVDRVEHAYRFTPMRIGDSDRARLHGVDERISVEDYGRVIDWYAHFVRSAAGP